jgi:hypothetical protein
MSNLDANEGADQKLWRFDDQDDGMEASFLIPEQRSRDCLACSSTIPPPILKFQGPS